MPMRYLNLSRPAALVLAAGVLIMILPIAGLAVFEVATADRIAPGVSALGVPLGGRSQVEAAALLAQPAQARLAAPLQVVDSSRSWGATVADAGVALDPSDLARRAFGVGHKGDLFQRLRSQADALVRGHDVSFDESADWSAVDRTVAGIAAEVDRPARDASVALSADGSISHTAAQTGRAVDRAATRQRIVAAVEAGRPTAAVAVQETAPAVVDTQVQPAYEQLTRLLDAQTPLTLTFEDRRWPLSKADVAALLTLQPGDGSGAPVRVVPREDLLAARVQALGGQIDQDVQDGRFAWQDGGHLKVLHDSQEGHTLDQSAAVQQIEASFESASRQVALPVKVQGSAVPTGNPDSLGIVELIDKGSTSFAGSQPEKRHNIALAAERLNGVVVPPHGTFSFNDAVGPTTIEAGFQWGFGIEAGKDGAHTVPSVGGGICQVATTLFQPVFWAGYQLEERYSHLYWIPAYTSRGVVGLDVTVDPDAHLDFKWDNPTDGYVLIQANVQGDTLNFALYGKKPDWQVHVDPVEIANQTPPDPTPVVEEDSTFPAGRTIQVESAREGFESTVTRTVTAPGEEPRTLRLHTVYQPSRNVTLVGTGGGTLASVGQAG